MYTDPDIEQLKELFASHITRDADVKRIILDLSTDLPTDDLKRAVSNVANWLLAVYKTTSTPAAGNVKARSTAITKENSKLRLVLEQQRFSPNGLKPLHDRTAQLVANSAFRSDYYALNQIKEFLTAQAKRRVATPADHRMSEAI